MKRSLLDLTVIIILALIAGSIDCAAATIKKPAPRPVSVTATPINIGTPPAMPSATTPTRVYTVAQIEAIKAQLRQGIQTAGLHAAMIPEGREIFLARAEAFDQVLENLEKLSPTTVQVVTTR